MAHVRNERGYALVIVLLVTVLFLGFSATFIAGSLSNAKQEQTIDTSNQSIAAAEMGVLYHTADFEEEMKEVRKEVGEEARILLDELKDCIRSENRTNCNTDEERSDWEDRIDDQLRVFYIEAIKSKTQQYETDNVSAKEPFDQLTYSLDSAEVQPVTEPSEMEIDMVIKGEADERSNDLHTTLTIEIPEDFIVKSDIQHDPIIIEQINNDVEYKDVFDFTKPPLACSDLVDLLGSEESVFEGECYAGPDEDMRDFSDLLLSRGLDPVNFTVYSENFTENFCRHNHCRNIDFNHLNIVVDQADVQVNNHMRYFSNFKLIIDGSFGTGNHLEDLGLEEGRQTIIMKELSVGNHLREIENTNLLILGNSTGNDAELSIGNKVEIGQNSNLCLDLDRISSSDWMNVADKIKFIGNGSLTFYSANSTLYFPLSGDNIFRAPSYESFLESCGFVLETLESIEVAVPVLIDTGFDFEVEY